MFAHLKMYICISVAHYWIAVEIYKRMKAHRETMRERKKKAFSRIMKSEVIDKKLYP